MSIERLNETIQRMVEQFNRDNKDEGISAKILATEDDVSIHYINLPKMRAEWVDWVIKRYDNDPQAIPLTIDRCNGVVVVKSPHHGIGTAVCGRDDTFNEETGLAIAYARSLGEEVPDYM